MHGGGRVQGTVSEGERVAQSPGRRRSKHKGLREAQPGALPPGTAGNSSTETLGLSQFVGERKRWELSPGSGHLLSKFIPWGFESLLRPLEKLPGRSDPRS